MKGYKVIIGLIALGFAAGMFGGYRIWGPTEKGKTDIRQLLQQVNDEVARIESKNKELADSLESSREAINASEALQKENQDLKDQLKVAYQEKQDLESTLEEVRAKERDAGNQAEDRQKLGSTIDALNARISALESENRELKSVIDNVSEMTQRKEVPGR